MTLNNCFYYNIKYNGNKDDLEIASRHLTDKLLILSCLLLEDKPMSFGKFLRYTKNFLSYSSYLGSSVYIIGTI